jgi:hypothetical protein
MKKFGLITLSITHEAHSRAIHVATLFKRLIHFVYLLVSAQLIVISTHDQIIIINDMRRMIVINKLIRDHMSFGNALTGVVAHDQHFLVCIQFPINGIFVFNFIQKQCHCFTNCSHAFSACSAFILSMAACIFEVSISQIEGGV